jgi:hypothetical protein
MIDLQRHRFQCEVRALLKLRYEKGEQARDQYIAEVRKKRGAQAVDELVSAAVEQWRLGNRGRPNDWR